MSYTVVFAPLAEEQLAELYRSIAEQASPETAARYTEAIVACCERLSNFPYHGAARDDIRPGLRITNYKGRTVIAFGVTMHPTAFRSSVCTTAVKTTNTPWGSNQTTNETARLSTLNRSR